MSIEITSVSRSNIVVYKRCSAHKHIRSNAEYSEALERECLSCAWAGRQATMRARGLPLTMPKYTGRWPHEGPNHHGELLLREPEVKEWLARQNEKRAHDRWEQENSYSA